MYGLLDNIEMGVNRKWYVCVCVCVCEVHCTGTGCG